MVLYTQITHCPLSLMVPLFRKEFTPLPFWDRSPGSLVKSCVGLVKGMGHGHMLCFPTAV